MLFNAAEARSNRRKEVADP